MDIKIERRCDHRGWCCVFKHNGQWYFADLTIVNYVVVECMIFKSDETGQFSFEDALGEYCNQDCEYSPEGLKKCIEEFMSNQ
jgi:hypothetical protein